MRITHLTLVGFCLVLSVSVAMAKEKQPDQMDMQAMMDTYKKGKCEEPKTDCKPTPAIFCQEGLCAFRYKPFQGPNDGIKIE